MGTGHFVRPPGRVRHRWRGESLNGPTRIPVNVPARAWARDHAVAERAPALRSDLGRGAPMPGVQAGRVFNVQVGSDIYSAGRRRRPAPVTPPRPGQPPPSELQPPLDGSRQDRAADNPELRQPAAHATLAAGHVRKQLHRPPPRSSPSPSSRRAQGRAGVRGLRSGTRIVSSGHAEARPAGDRASVKNASNCLPG